MLNLFSVRGLVVALMMSGLVCPNQIVIAQQVAGNKEIVDSGTVLLGPKGQVSGVIVDANGRGVEGAAIAVIQNGKLALNTKTNSDGHFKATGLRAGKCVVVTNQGARRYELLEQPHSQVKAKKGIVVVVDPQVARGAFARSSAGLIGTLLLAGIVAGAIIAADDDDGDAS